MGLQEILVANIKRWRKHAGLTQERLAELCDTDPCYIRQIETGRRCPSLPYIERIAVALSIAPYQLFYDEFESAAVVANIDRKRQITAALIESVSQGIQSVIDELC
ncbi:MAG: helix-turn-helix domain-containing protein [Treponema sp.]|jgi:transcriptional regulator with XRE-family HTH domain|nr:helix-turn-helix domain-containing protein [Treponema sp.]